MTFAVAMMSGEEGIEIETEHVRLLPVTSGGGGRYLLRVGDLSASATGAFSGGMLWMTPILFVRLSGGTMDWRAQEGELRDTSGGACNPL